MTDLGPRPPGDEPHYNPMFERFVPPDAADDGYLSGLVAYALYKSRKQEWARSLHQRMGRPPNADDVAGYTATWTAGQIAATKAQAVGALSSYAEAVVEDARPGILQEALRGGFWKSVGASMTAAAFYTIILLGLAYGAHVLGIDLLSAYQGTAPVKATAAPSPASNAVR